VLYLAEVQKKTGLMGGKAELKLLACQRTEQLWNAVQGDDIIPMPTEQANNYNSGALVIVDLNNGKQIQRFLEAGRQLVNILQNFSRVQEKAKGQEDEIEQWKASLTFQSQELQRREIELEAQQEQVQNMDAELSQLQQQREEIQRLQTEVDSKQQNLEKAWTHLEGEQKRLEELQSQISTSGGLDPEQANYLQTLLEQVSVAPDQLSGLQNHFQDLQNAIEAQQSTLAQYWQQLEQVSASAQQLQLTVEQQIQGINSRTDALQQAQRSLEQAKIDLAIQQQAYQFTQDLYKKLSGYLENQTHLYQQLCQLTGQTDEDAAAKVDLAALMQIPLAELQQLADNLQRDLTKMSRFVSDQEEELTYQQQAIDELQVKMQQASEYDRLRLEPELADEQDRYRLLDEALVGQRRNLRERAAILKLHTTILQKRQGGTDAEANSEQAWEGVMRQVMEQRQQQASDLQQLDTQVQQQQQSIQQLQAMLQQCEATYTALKTEVYGLETNLKSCQIEAATATGRMQTYQELLQTLQDQLNQTRQCLNTSVDLYGQLQTSYGQRSEFIAQAQQVLTNLLPRH
jgi:chromosome segregation ATPase